MLSKDYIRSIIFGLEDALVSTTGLVVGVAIGSGRKETVLLAGIVGLCVEATSMASGEYISQTTGSTQKKIKLATFMFISYIAGGLFSIIPVFIFDKEYIVMSAIISSAFGLLLLGWGKAVVLKQDRKKSALQVVIIGGFSMAIGLIAGKLVGTAP